jgi:hypothetical protein
LAFVTQTAFQGSYATNPYNFQQSFGAAAITKVSLSLNGTDIDGLSSGQVALDYLRIFLMSDTYGSPFGNGLSIDKFKGGFYFAFFDLTTALSSSSVLQNPVTRAGQVRVAVNFSSSLQENIVCLVYSEYPSIIKITEDRKIETNYLT